MTDTAHRTPGRVGPDSGDGGVGADQKAYRVDCCGSDEERFQAWVVKAIGHVDVTTVGVARSFQGAVQLAQERATEDLGLVRRMIARLYRRGEVICEAEIAYTPADVWSRRRDDSEPPAWEDPERWVWTEVAERALRGFPYALDESEKKATP